MLKKNNEILLKICFYMLSSIIFSLIFIYFEQICISIGLNDKYIKYGILPAFFAIYSIHNTINLLFHKKTFNEKMLEENIKRKSRKEN